ncbi:unnamed protein product [Absidia cylindrospora]
MPTLIRLFSRSNKVHVRNTLTCFKTIVENSKVPRTTHRLCLILKNNNSDTKNTAGIGNIGKSTRYHVTECLNAVIQVNATNDLVRYVADIEAAIKNTAMDSAPEVRSSIRMCYKLYCEKIPDHASKFSETLSPEILRYLQVTTGHRTSSTTAGLKATLGKRPLANTAASSESPSKRRHMPSSPLKSRRTATSSKESGSATPATSRTRNIPTPTPSAATTTRSTPKSISSISSSTKPSSSLSSTSSTSSSLPRPKSSTASYLSATTSSAAKRSTALTTTSLSKATSSLTPNLRTKYLAQNNSNLHLQPDFRLEPRVYIRGKPPMRQRKVTPQPNDEGGNNTEDGNNVTSPTTSDGSSTLHKRTSPMNGLSQQEDTGKTQG